MQFSYELAPRKIPMRFYHGCWVRRNAVMRELEKLINLIVNEIIDLKAKEKEART